MSGFISKLKNKVTYKINQAVDDPAANEFAEKEKEQQQKNVVQPKSIQDLRNEKMEAMRKDPSFSKKLEELQGKLMESVQQKFKSEGKSDKEAQEGMTSYLFNTLAPTINDLIDKGTSVDGILSFFEDQIDQFTDTEDPNTISPWRILKKMRRYIEKFISIAFFPFLAIVVSMYVANEMIVHPAPIRAGFFILTFLACILFQPAAIIMAIYYVAKSGYSYYVNEMTAREKQRIMPTIFSILPLTTYQPEGFFESFFYYPFTYPKSKKDKEELPLIMEEYQAKLNESFPYLEKIKSLSFVSEGLALIKENVKKMHEPPIEPGIPTNQSRSNQNGPPLPPVIQPLPKKNQTNKNKVNQNQSVPPANQASIPPVIVPTEEAKEEQKEETLPPVIVPTEEVKEESNQTTVSPVIAPVEEAKEEQKEATLPPVIAPVEEVKEEQKEETLPPVIAPIEEAKEEQKEETLPPVISSPESATKETKEA